MTAAKGFQSSADNNTIHKGIKSIISSLKTLKFEGKDCQQSLMDNFC